ncbi:spore coat U domain-containing protein [Dyella sp. S184]|uniref:Csu type fimbrial protein n=1 Tax=Dyella sp. S184 TaxID=1641862 RepID=UPI00131BE200|nr:spore coat U domain-containing protein [Dyella sp. S184]
MFKKTLLATAVLVFGGFAINASAATQPTSFAVTATVINDCVISSTNIAFGNYDPTVATVITAQGAVTALCTMGDVVSVGLNQGLTPGTGSTAAVPVRQMVNGTNDLPYHIYIASSGTTEWGTGTVGTNEPAAQTSASVLIPLSFVTYGSLPAHANVPAGSYSDTVVATVTY